MVNEISSYNSLIKKTCDQVFYIDPDICFFSSFEFFAQYLEFYSILLTPHWRCSNPYIDPSNFAILQTSGLFNAGFIGVSKNGIPAMEWWSKVCLYKCIKDSRRGLFVDQSYLDLIPIYFDNVKILKHKGCNIANWNQVECKRTINEKGEVLINNSWIIVFIHFTKSTIRGIKNGQDSLLKKHLEQYEAMIQKYKDCIPQEISSQ